MRCPACGGADLVHDTRDYYWTYKGHTTTIPDVDGDYCPACDEALLGPQENRRVMRAMKAFSRGVNSEFVDPEYIAGVRLKLNLDQRQVGQIFGGGVSAFSRYETGKTRPSVALVKLLQVLDRHPELLDEIRGAA